MAPIKLVPPARLLPSTAYFRDAKRVIDFVLVYEDDEASTAASYRQMFELRLKRYTYINYLYSYNMDCVYYSTSITLKIRCLVRS